MSTTFKQEVPPPGGFRPLDFSRISAKTYFGGKTLIIGNFVISFVAFYLYSLGRRHLTKEKIENTSSMLAIKPLLLAERDREGPTKQESDLIFSRIGSPSASKLLFNVHQGILHGFLKQLRRNRDEEAKLMENVEGWEVGKYKGEPVYKTFDEDTLIIPTINEYFVHTYPKYLKKYANLWLWN